MWSNVVWQISDKGQCDGLLDMPSNAVRSGETGKEVDEEEQVGCLERGRC